ncbi:phosphonate ABC transporter, permease protein PhnE [Nesterenkonia sp. E16_7]|uniref:phosphonate ABC transporter, permease protein PhnE n=1 Tax=unclassified Nesterenkonia TaxID=2629769 RepID=UPI001A921507|nr:phosphonate ABC transporter, permease protein PhnE [Nesterenkonia sp. E16_10]MBO0599224.1 phosphonate ABC transporter, permease protein PhnE [Nesterenkonia sp. E16_7]
MSTRKINAGPGSTSRPEHQRPAQNSEAGQPRFAPDALDRRPVRPSRLGYNAGMLVVGILFIAAIYGTGMDVRALLDLPASIIQYGQLMASGVFQIPEETVAGYWSQSFDAMFESVAIAWVGTMVGALFSLPLGFMAARNMSPLPVYVMVRFILSVIRAVPEIIFAIAIMLPLFGFGSGGGGALAGAMALGISSIGTLSKLISEAIEAVDGGPLESSRASGSNHLQLIRWAVLPQVMPEVIAIWLYRFEVNIRASAILGVLGAGGIGSLLSTVFGARDWDRIGIVLVVIILVTMVVDQISAFIRHRVIHGPTVRNGGGEPQEDDDDGAPSPGPVSGSHSDTSVEQDPAPKSARAAAGL